MPLRSPFRAIALALAIVAAAGTAATAQSQGPTLMQWLRGGQAPAPPPQPTSAPASAQAPIVGHSVPAAAPVVALAAPPPTRDGRFYVRADFGAGLRTELDESAGSCASSSALDLCGFSARGSAGAAYGGTVGFGYRVTEWLRADATFSYRYGEQVAGQIDRVNGQPASAALGMHTDAATLIFNFYLDVVPALGFPRSWFQPYIGAGFGPSFNHTRSSTVVGNLPGGLSGAQLPSHTTSDIAWNAGGGLAIRLFNGFATDLGYRYVDLGGFRTGTGVAQPSGAPVDSLRFKMRLHEIYLGFRVMFD